MITNITNDDWMAKKLDWLEANGYSQIDVLQDDDGLDFVWSVGDNGSPGDTGYGTVRRRIYLDLEI